MLRKLQYLKYQLESNTKGTPQLQLPRPRLVWVAEEILSVKSDSNTQELGTWSYVIWIKEYMLNFKSTGGEGGGGGIAGVY